MTLKLNVHRLFHGTTLHGHEPGPALAREPFTYFTRSGPIGRVFEWLLPGKGQAGSRVAILGLGAGTLARRSPERNGLSEIDPVVAGSPRIHGTSRIFATVRASSTNIVLGDARLRLQEAPDHAFRLIVLDAFSSDSLPVHLLSREAIQLYRAKLAPGGVLVFNLQTGISTWIRCWAAKLPTPASLAASATTWSSVPARSGPAKSLRFGQ